jgi:ankyrin repeat protein
MIQPEALKQARPWMWSTGIGTDVWAMLCACSAGDLETVRSLVERDPSLVRCHYEYRTPLSFSIRENHWNVVAFLLDNGASKMSLGNPIEMASDRGLDEMVELLERRYHELHGTSEEGEPVAAAIRARNIGTVRRLLAERPGRIHAADRTSNQPIHWAVMTRNIEMIDEVLAHGADINAQRGDGALPIHLTNGDYDYRGWRDVPEDVRTTPAEVYRHLVTHGAEVDLGMAAYQGDIERVREILADDPAQANRVSEYNSYYIGCGAPLKNAVAGGHIEIVRLLLAHGADPNLPEEGIAPQGHALYTAVSRGDYAIAKLLLERGAYPNPAVESSADAVWIAIRAGDKRVLELLGSYGATMGVPLRLDGQVSYPDIVAAGIERPLHILAYYGDLNAAAELLARKPALANDREALEMAAGQGHEEFVRLLLRFQPDLARQVTFSKPRQIAQLLFALGMDPNRPDWLHKTPLHHFAANGDIESAALFLENGADLHARDEEHRSTPLAVAAMKGQTRMVEFLLRRGARPELPEDPPWATPMAWARRRGHEDVIRVLERFQASELPPSPSWQSLEGLANDLVTAFASGDERALANIRKHFRLDRHLTWDRPALEVQVRRLRSAIEERLDQMGEPRERSDALSLAHARLLIARSEGYADWTALMAELRDREAN